MSPAGVSSFVKTQAVEELGLADISKKLCTWELFVEVKFCSLTLTGALMIAIIQAKARDVFSINFIMSWPHNADNYYFCLEINLNFGMKERFKINILLWGRRDGSLGKALAA